MFPRTNVSVGFGAPPLNKYAVMPWLVTANDVTAALAGLIAIRDMLALTRFTGTVTLTPKKVENGATQI